MDCSGLAGLTFVVVCCLGKKEEVEVALVVLFGDVGESLLVSVFEEEDCPTDFLMPVLLKRSSMDLCFIFSAPWLLLLL